jgi:16S rRNA (adenine1518-N6/adenine1519-N6)-dimethyltransferase
MVLKKLGQNFLIDSDIAKREIQYCNINKNDVVLEIGPGKGIITYPLAKKANKVIAIEIDKNLFINLKKTIPPNVLLINEDILKIEFDKIPNFNKIVSNLPFQISSEITFKILEKKFNHAILMYQKEFAERIVAKANTKQYSRLSVGVYYKAKSRIIETIPKEYFDPTPKVDSCIVEIIPRKKPPFNVKDEKFFFNLNRILFNHRRKKIKTIIKKIFKIDIGNNLFSDYRVENLSPEEIGGICNNLHEILKR